MWHQLEHTYIHHGVAPREQSRRCFSGSKTIVTHYQYYAFVPSRNYSRIKCTRQLRSFVLKDTEGLLALNDTLGFMCNHVESDRLGKRTALSNGNNISFLDGKGR